MKLAPPVLGGQICGRWGGVRDYGTDSVTHWGYDLCTDHAVGVPIYNLLPGIVVDVTTSEHGGNQIVLFWGTWRGQKLFARHSHCDRIFRREGDYCRQYEVIATVGKTGVNAAGRPISAHLHLQVMDKIAGGDPVDMPSWLKSIGIEERNNTLVWSDGYPHNELFGSVLLGVGASFGLYALSQILKSRTPGIAGFFTD